MLASLLVASTTTGAAPGNAMSSAGSCTSPPPPDTASIQPAKPAAMHSSRTVERSGTYASGPGGPAIDDVEEVGQPGDDGIGRAFDVAPLLGRDVAVGHQNGLYADLLGAVDVVVGPVADED